MTRNKKGFTLAELLIVIVIIAILVCISIAIFSTQSSKAKESVDLANIRSAKAAVLTEYLTTDESSSVYYYYDASTGKLASSASRIQGYGKSDHEVSGANGIPYENGQAKILYLTIDPTQVVTITWRAGGLQSGETITMGSSTYNAMSYINSITKGNLNGTIDTNSKTDQANKIASTLNTSFGDVRTWMVSSKETKNSSKLITWVSDVNISTLKAGTWVRVMRYNTNKSPATYTPCYVKTVTRNGVTSIPEFGTSKIGQISKTSKYYSAISSSTTDYDKALEEYNSAPMTK